MLTLFIYVWCEWLRTIQVKLGWGPLRYAQLTMIPRAKILPNFHVRNLGYIIPAHTHLEVDIFLVISPYRVTRMCRNRHFNYWASSCLALLERPQD